MRVHLQASCVLMHEECKIQEPLNSLSPSSYHKSESISLLCEFVDQLFDFAAMDVSLIALYVMRGLCGLLIVDVLH